MKIAFLLSIIILFYNEFSLHMKSKVRGRRKTRENATRRTTSMCVFKELAEIISSIIAKFEGIPLQFFLTFGIWQCLLFFKVTLESGIDVAPYTVQTYVVKFKSFKSVIRP